MQRLHLSHVINYVDLYLQNCQHGAWAEWGIANHFNEISFQVPATTYYQMNTDKCTLTAHKEQIDRKLALVC